MPRKYTHLEKYEKEILELKAKGLTRKEIGKKLNLSPEQVHSVTKRHNKKRHNKKQQKLASGIPIKPKGRPRKEPTELPPSVQQMNKVSQLQYELSSKERYIKRLEMENELMRDFLSLTERK